MSNDDFWTSLATGHTNTVLAGSMDAHLTGMTIDESFGTVRTLVASKQASGYTVKVRRDGGQLWIEAKGELVGPFTAADALREVERHIKNPDVVVMGRNHSLGRSGAADAYSMAPFVILDRRGDVVDEGYSLESLWGKWFDRFLGWRMASVMRVASLGDLTQFLKRADGKLVHKSTNDLWSYSKDADGNFLVERLFDDEGEPLKG